MGYTNCQLNKINVSTKHNLLFFIIFELSLSNISTYIRQYLHALDKDKITV